MVVFKRTVSSRSMIEQHFHSTTVISSYNESKDDDAMFFDNCTTNDAIDAWLFRDK